MTPLELEAEMVSEAAEEAGGARCIQGEAVFWLPNGEGKAVRPGHIYSEAGRQEFKISRCCEFHFDSWFAEED